MILQAQFDLTWLTTPKIVLGSWELAGRPSTYPYATIRPSQKQLTFVETGKRLTSDRVVFYESLTTEVWIHRLHEQRIEGASIMRGCVPGNQERVRKTALSSKTGYDTIVAPSDDELGGSSHTRVTPWAVRIHARCNRVTRRHHSVTTITPGSSTCSRRKIRDVSHSSALNFGWSHFWRFYILYCARPNSRPPLPKTCAQWMQILLVQ